MRRVKAIIEYCGDNYGGFQIQPNARTVQAELEEKLTDLLGQSIKVIASGRTDAGVHALGQVIHFDCDGDFPLGRLPLALASALPSDIAVLEACEAPPDWHARYSAKNKTYVYKVLLTKVNRPMNYKRSYQYPYKVDCVRMQEAAELLIGEHDFKAFMATGSKIEDTHRTVNSLDISMVRDEITFLINANGFLYNMVRIIVGTLLDIGRSRLKTDAIAAMLESGDRDKGGITAPPWGLYLVQVNY